jgi:hypothetical protein
VRVQGQAMRLTHTQHPQERHSLQQHQPSNSPITAWTKQPSNSRFKKVAVEIAQRKIGVHLPTAAQGDDVHGHVPWRRGTAHPPMQHAWCLCTEWPRP